MEPDRPRLYADLTQNQLVALARRVLVAAAREEADSIEHAMKVAAYYSVISELRHRIFERVMAEITLSRAEL